MLKMFTKIFGALLSICLIFWGIGFLIAWVAPIVSAWFETLSVHMKTMVSLITFSAFISLLLTAGYALLNSGEVSQSAYEPADPLDH